MENERTPSHSERAPMEAPLEGSDIAKILQSDGPVVTCVLLKAAKRSMAEEDGDKKPSASTKAKNKIECGSDDNIEEIQVDTTPRKNHIEEVLGGPFTFIGQYESEGVILMGLRGFVEEGNGEEGEDNDDSEKETSQSSLHRMPICELREQCTSLGINMDTMLEKQDLVDAVIKAEKQLPPTNQHKLQPPLHRMKIRGDILVLKVAEVHDHLDHDESSGAETEKDEDGNTDTDTADVKRAFHPKDNKGDGVADQEVVINAASLTAVDYDTEVKRLTMPSNKEFFLSYSKEEYLKFAARTDINPREVRNNGAVNDGDNENDSENGDQEQEGNGSDNEGGDEDYQLAAGDMEEMTEEEEKSAMLNIVMSELLRKFREENDRGPNSREVLEIRASVAEQLGMEVALYDATQDVAASGTQGSNSNATDSSNDRKRPADSEPTSCRKRVKFHSSIEAESAAEENTGVSVVLSSQDLEYGSGFGQETKQVPKPDV